MTTTRNIFLGGLIVGVTFGAARAVAGQDPTSAITSGTWLQPTLVGQVADPTDGSHAGSSRNLRDERVRVVFRDRPSLRVGRSLRIDLRAKMQVDHRAFSVGARSGESVFDVSRKRIGLDGRLFDRIAFQLERELQSENPWRDAFVDIRATDGLHIRGGKFKMPFSLDRLTSPARLDFVNRSRIADALAPGRAVGIGVHGRLWRRALGYDAGVFAHGGDDTRVGKNTVTRPTGAGRITIRPSGLTGGRPDSRALEIGADVTVGDVREGLHSLRGHTTLDTPLSDPVYVRGQRVRLGLDAAWAFRSLSVRSELLRLSDERLGQGFLGDDLPPLVARGWYVSGAWVATGEDKSDNIEPRRALFRGGIGAVELAARHERMSYSSGSGTTAPSRSPRATDVREAGDRLWTFGVNWYLNRWVKLQANLVRDELGAEDAEAPSDRRVHWTKLVRLQFSM